LVPLLLLRVDPGRSMGLCKRCRELRGKEEGGLRQDETLGF
jgi:hypothetical protein